MASKPTIRVGDVGTTFKGELRDAGDAYDPSGASIKKLIFYTPNNVTIERNATVTSTGSGSTTKWFLQYTVVAADITAGLHAELGTYSWQGYIEYANGDIFHTTIENYKVSSNLGD
jgi:hypothetical protein